MQFPPRRDSPMFRLALHWQILLGVLLAAAIGVTLNFTLSTRHSRTNLGDDRFLDAFDSVDRIELKLIRPDGSLIDGQEFVVDSTGRGGGNVFLTLEQLHELQPEAYRLFYEHARSTARKFGDFGYAIGHLFLRLLKMVAVPLIITSLMTGILGLADAGRLRRLFSLTVAYYVVTSAGNRDGHLLRQPDPARLPAEVAQRATDFVASEGLGATLYQQLQAMIPENPFQALAQADFLSIIAFRLAVGIFTILVGGRTLEVFRDFFQAGFDVMMRMTMAIIALAPYGVFFLMLYATATQGVVVFDGWPGTCSR